MLAISRTRGEALRVGDDITIVVIRVSPTRVVLGIDAPQSVRVMRSELLESATTQGANDAERS